MVHYHLSRIDHGDKFEFTPKLPGSANPKECKQTKRVCFSPTLWQCMIGVCGTPNLAGIIEEFLLVAEKYGTQPVVYETRRKLFAPKTVSDYAVTGEVWALEPITCRRKGYVDLMYLILHGKVKLRKEPTIVINKDFYAGWKAGWETSSVNWKATPPKMS